MFGWDPLTPWLVSGGGVSFGFSSPVHVYLIHTKGLMRVTDTKLNYSLTCEGQCGGSWQLQVHAEMQQRCLGKAKVLPSTFPLVMFSSGQTQGCGL